VMPLVWQADPTIPCLLVGEGMPASLAGPNVELLGHVEDLAEIFARVRLTAAPLRFGAGVKGKVLQSFAAGLPCVMSPIAAEGLSLPEGLDTLVGRDAAELAGLITLMHTDAARNGRAARAGRAWLARDFSAQSIRRQLRSAITKGARGQVLPMVG